VRDGELLSVLLCGIATFLRLGPQGLAH
jgi:hypothetical protein